MTQNSVGENDNEIASETVVSAAVPERRRLFRRLLALAGLGITGVLLSQDRGGLVPPVQANPGTVFTASSDTDVPLTVQDYNDCVYVSGSWFCSPPHTANLQEWKSWVPPGAHSETLVTVARVDCAGRFSSNAVNAEYRLVGQETNGRTWRLFSDGTSFNFADATAGQNLAVFATDAVTFTRRLLPSPAGVLDLGIVGLQWNHVTANQFVTISQSTLKHDIAEIKDLDYLSSVPAPIYYKLNKAPDNRTYLGFMGDQLPDLAKAEGGGVYLNAVIGILCGAVRELQSTVQEQQNQIEELKSQIAS